MSLSDVLKKRRSELGYTLLEIADKMGVSEATVQRWESGNIKSLRQGRISQLSEILCVSPAYLMGWEETKSIDSVAGRLLAIMKYRKISLSKLSGMLSVPVSDLYDFIYKTPDNEFEYNDPRLYNIAQVLEVNVDAFWGYNTFTGDDFENYISFLFDKVDKNLPLTERESDILKSYINGTFDDLELYQLNNIIPIPSTKKVPLLGTIACGEPILANENIEMYIKVDESIPADFALKCKGDSMINARIFDGDIVYIRQQPDVEDGEIAAVLIGDEATLKKVHKYPNKIVLSACNPMYDDYVYTNEQLNEIRILGKAVAFFSVIR